MADFNKKSGYELEQKFWDWLDNFIPAEGEERYSTLLPRAGKDYRQWTNDDIALECAKWLSCKSKASQYDFVVRSNSTDAYYIDVVGVYPYRKGIRLITKDKSWAMKLAYLKNKRECGGYLAFTLNGGIDWMFLKIHNQLPLGDILLTPHRMKQLLSAYDLFVTYLTEEEWQELQEDDWSISK